jgi:hypothetical protein
MAAILRVTRRCLLDDLGVDPDALDRTLEELAETDDVLKSFFAKRSQSPEGQETIQGLKSRIVAYSLHSGDSRGITWHHKEHDVVWLLAARFHRSGKPDDAYPYFVELDHAARLLPTRDDLEDLVASQRETFAKALLENVPRIREPALERPGLITEGVIGGRVPVRFALEEGDPAIRTVAISQRLLPGRTQVPPGWQLAIAAAFLSGATSIDDLSFAGDIAGEPLRADEIAYCDFGDEDFDS